MAIVMKGEATLEESELIPSPDTDNRVSIRIGEHIILFSKEETHELGRYLRNKIDYPIVEWRQFTTFEQCGLELRENWLFRGGVGQTYTLGFFQQLPIRSKSWVYVHIQQEYLISYLLANAIANELNRLNKEATK